MIDDRLFLETLKVLVNVYEHFILNNWKRSLLVGVKSPSSTNKGDTIKG
jgi:hypothetical protein